MRWPRVRLSAGGFEAQGEAETVTRGVPTAARIPAGAIIEREVGFALDDLTLIRLALRNPDFTTAERIAAAINGRLGAASARAVDSATVTLPVPAGLSPGGWRSCWARSSSSPVEPDTVARILIDERSGIIVMGDNVQISRVAVAQGNLTVRVTETPQVSQPNPLADGRTVEVPRTEIEVDEQSGNRMVALEPGVTLRDLVDGLNALGVGPRDLIGILQAIKAAGALQAEIEVI